MADLEHAYRELARQTDDMRAALQRIRDRAVQKVWEHYGDDERNAWLAIRDIAVEALLKEIESRSA